MANTTVSVRLGAIDDRLAQFNLWWRPFSGTLDLLRRQADALLIAGAHRCHAGFPS
jgi:hypothetical protein